MQRQVAGCCANPAGTATTSRFLGMFLSEPKPDVVFDPPGPGAVRAAFARPIARRGVELDRRTQWLYDTCDLSMVRPSMAGGRRAIDDRARRRAQAQRAQGRVALRGRRPIPPRRIRPWIPPRRLKTAAAPVPRENDSTRSRRKLPPSTNCRPRAHRLQVFDIDLSQTGWNARGARVQSSRVPARCAHGPPRPHRARNAVARAGRARACSIC